MKALLSWLDHRTGIRQFLHEALYENVPGGARWRYVWGSTLVFTFFVQAVTGVFLWMSYSPSANRLGERVLHPVRDAGGMAAARLAPFHRPGHGRAAWPST